MYPCLRDNKRCSYTRLHEKTTSFGCYSNTFTIKVRKMGLCLGSVFGRTFCGNALLALIFCKGGAHRCTQQCPSTAPERSSGSSWPPSSALLWWHQPAKTPIL